MDEFYGQGFFDEPGKTCQQKQIEEMTVDICPRITTCEDCEDDIKSNCPYTTLAKSLIEQGYQKIDKGMMVISEEEYIRLNQTVNPKKIRKDAVKEIAEWLNKNFSLSITGWENFRAYFKECFGVEVK